MLILFFELDVGNRIHWTNVIMFESKQNNRLAYYLETFFCFITFFLAYLNSDLHRGARGHGHASVCDFNCVDLTRRDWATAFLFSFFNLNECTNALIKKIVET